MTSKNKCLTLNEKIKLIESSEKDKLTVKQICELFKCGKSQVYNILKQKNEIKEQWMNGNGRMKRKPKSNANEEINNLTWEWFVSARAKNIPISGPIIQTKARQIAEQMSVTEFKASNGWLESFKNQHNIVWHQICGESNSVDVKNVDEWKVKVKLIIEGYEPKNIYNGDETGLFFRALPSKTLSVKSEECKGVKPCTSIDVEQSSSEDETDNVPLHGNDIKTYKNALHEIKRLEMFALDQNNENELLESILNLKNLVEKKMASQITKQKTLDEFWSKI
ncbi:unnamed protein product [Macrosiphum euphorbiae]|uniref:Transposase n=1 Tax=Macrosiphum euphorbiae TaxID=13131 RepID=A0AAV0Y9M5_9HEMI|nr:unnamed protein product [Macrosiphum euphorbiae]